MKRIPWSFTRRLAEGDLVAQVLKLFPFTSGIGDKAFAIAGSV